MGIIWRNTMGLLSLLAALVIIVHTEDMDTEYRRGLRPRALDTETSRQEQSWRAQEVEPIQRSTQSWDENTPEERPKRLRPVRKRKRRPQPLPGEVYILTHPEETPQQYIDSDLSNLQTTDIPKRRRKNPVLVSNRWIDLPFAADRPMRRHGQRKKRPSLDTWPRLSEFGEFQPDDTQRKEVNIQTGFQQSDQYFDDRPVEHFVRKDYDNDEDLIELGSEITTTDSVPIDDGAWFISDNEQQSTFNNGDFKSDKSLSEFSIELSNPPVPPREPDQTIQQREKNKEKILGTLSETSKAQDKYILNINDKSYGYINRDTYEDVEVDDFKTFKNNVEDIKAKEKINCTMNILNFLEASKSGNSIKKCKEKNHQKYKRLALDENVLPMVDEFNVGESAIDPQTLKELLKRSHGTSLSEILQQHNLSLADLLSGKQNAVSILNAKNTVTKNKTEDLEVVEKEENIDLEQNCTTDVAENTTTNATFDSGKETNDESSTITAAPLLVNGVRNVAEHTPKLVAKRRFPGTIRRKQHMRLPLNNTLNVNIHRQVLPLNARNLYPNRRNISKLRERPEIIPIKPNVSDNNITESSETETIPIFISPDQIVLAGDEDKNITATRRPTNTGHNITDIDNVSIDVTDIPFSTTMKETENLIQHIQEIESSTLAPAPNATTLRRQAFSNRLKKKRLKMKNSTTESPQDDLMKNLFGMGNLVSSSEFIARTQPPKPPTDGQRETPFEDLITTESSSKIANRLKSTKLSGRLTATPIQADIQVTEETTKIEIEEILNDSQTSEKLSRILMERNMTLSELVEQRERGSSHIHLADIFHNQSKEPNPSEPFLSKSFIEPISKETYPLRAILEANQHDPNAKVAPIDSNVVDGNYVNIPVAMDFGNNVNENAENMGIVSLFHNFTKDEIKTEKSALKKDSEGAIYKISITNVNLNHTHNEDDTVRESRVLHDDRDAVVNWKEIFSLMQNQNNNSEINEGLSHLKSKEKVSLVGDIDGDGLIVLEDLHPLKDFNSKIASTTDGGEVKFSNNIDTEGHSSGNPVKLPNNTRSVTVVTASIAGLAMILFLLTYAAFKWKQQRRVNGKKNSFCDERIPTPVFESRKGHKNNCSSRSISPMLSSSNIYTLNTLDSHNGKDSPDYMWDSLRKPFQ